MLGPQKLLYLHPERPGRTVEEKAGYLGFLRGIQRQEVDIQHWE